MCIYASYTLYALCYVSYSNDVVVLHNTSLLYHMIVDERTLLWL